MPRDLLLFPMPFSADVMFYFEDIRPLSRGEFVLKRLNKVVFWVPISGEETTQVSDKHFQIWLSSEYVAQFGWVPFRELRG